MPIRLPKESCEQWLRDCDESQVFVCINGVRARNVKELVKLFEKLSDDDYRYHVTSEKNDFANWVQGVFQNGHLSANFRSARSKKEAFQYVKRHHLMLLRNLRDSEIREKRKAEKKGLRLK